MTITSPILSSGAFLSDKGSTYGITSRWFGHYSFQGSQGSRGLGNQNRTKVLYSQAAICSLQSRSIIKFYEQMGSE